MLHAKEITKAYGKVEVLRGVDLSLVGGEIVALVGASGAGKTTLLQVVSTLDTPDRGQLTFEDADLRQFSRRQQARFRNQELGFIFQFHYLMAEFTALENVMMPALIMGRRKSKVSPAAESLLDEFGMSHRLTHKPSALSGGEQQRVAVARALINEPKLIMADEPTGNLDSRNRQAIVELFREQARKRGVGFLVATHNEDFAAAADRIIRISDGRIQSEETTAHAQQRA